MSDLFHPVADDLWGGPSDAVHLQPHLAPAAQAALAEAGARAAALWPGRLNLVPGDTLHVTIYPLVRVPGSFDRAAYWAAIEPASRALLADLAARAAPFTLRFRKLRVASAGIIALAEDESGTIAAMRRAIVETIPPPPGLDPIRYDIIHATLARFAATDPVPRSAVEAVEALSLGVDAVVEHLKLTRETRFPCLVAEEIGQVSLSGDPV